jgi:hypothetical protein
VTEREGKSGEREHAGWVPLFKQIKNVITHKKTKLNSDYTIEFVSINPSKLDLTWIYLDKVISGSHC